MPEPSQSSLFHDEIYLLFCSCVCALTLLLLTLSFLEIPIIPLWNLWCAASSFFFCATVSGYHSSAPYNIVDITNDSNNLTLSVVLMSVLPYRFQSSKYAAGFADSCLGVKKEKYLIECS